MKKHKGYEIYSLADEYIHEMVKFDMRGVISKHNKRFHNLFYKSLPEILRAKITPEMIKEIIECSQQRLKQAEHFKIHSQNDQYDEDLVQKYFKEFIEKLENLPL